MRYVMWMISVWSVFYIPFSWAATPQASTTVFLPFKRGTRLLWEKKLENKSFKLGNLTDLRNYFSEYQSFKSKIALERMELVAADLLKNRYTAPTARRQEQMMEIIQIQQEAEHAYWYGPFLSIRLFMEGIIDKNPNALRQLFSSTDNLPPFFPQLIHNAIDVSTAEFLAQTIKVLRSNPSTQIVIQNAYEDEDASFCDYLINGQPAALNNLRGIAGTALRIEEFCAHGTYRSLMMSLKPFQNQAIVSLPANATLQKLEKPKNHDRKAKRVASNAIIVAAPESLKMSTHTPHWKQSILEIYPTLWWGFGKYRTLHQPHLPTSNFLSGGIMLRKSDFALSIDIAKTYAKGGFRYTILPRLHWAQEFSPQRFHPFSFRTALGLGSFVELKNKSLSNPMMEKDLFLSAAIHAIYQFNTPLHFAVGQELDISPWNPRNRLFGISLRGGYTF